MVIVGIVGRLDLAAVALHLASTDGCGGETGGHALALAAPFSGAASTAYPRKRPKSLFPPSCCCSGIQPTADWQQRRAARGACPRKNGLQTQPESGTALLPSAREPRHKEVKKGKTFQRSFSPEAVADLHVVVPAQVTPEDVHGGEIQNNLRGRRKEKQGNRSS